MVTQFLESPAGSNDWSSSKLIVAAIFASIIGTLIYHIEKTSSIASIIGMIFTLVSLITYYNLPLEEWMATWTILPLWRLALVILITGGVVMTGYYLWSFICWYPKQKTQTKESQEPKGPAFQKVLNETYLIWKMKAQKDQKELWGHIKTWADLIHCGYTTAFAYFAGSIVAIISLNTERIDITDNRLFMTGLIFSICLVFFELFCECHKQLQIDKILDDK